MHHFLQSELLCLSPILSGLHSLMVPLEETDKGVTMITLVSWVLGTYLRTVPVYSIEI